MALKLVQHVQLVAIKAQQVRQAVSPAEAHQLVLVLGILVPATLHLDWVDRKLDLVIVRIRFVVDGIVQLQHGKSVETMSLTFGLLITPMAVKDPVVLF